jgi:hypothetical protein
MQPVFAVMHGRVPTKGAQDNPEHTKLVQGYSS